METILNYEQLLAHYKQHSSVPYTELLKCQEWKNIRADVLDRDEYTCQNCGQVRTVYLAPQHYYVEELSREELFDSDGNFGGYHISFIHTPASKAVILHVHHSYYILSCKPWQYDFDALITLCSECHADFHQNNRVPIWFDESRKRMANLTPYPRCHGAGHFVQYPYVQGGRCFYCSGAMYIELMR